MQNVCSAPDYHADEKEDKDDDDEDINYDDGDDEDGLGHGDLGDEDFELHLAWSAKNLVCCTSGFRQ